MRVTFVRILAITASWLLIASVQISAATYQVGPTRTYKTLQAVTDLLGPGDIVEVDGNAAYPGGVTFENAGTASQPITIRGIRVNGARPVISGGTNTVAFVSPWPYNSGADHYVFEGFDLTGGSSRCLYHQADDLTVRDVVVHDCPAHGILGADGGSGSMLIEFSEVYNCGNGTGQHQIYMATNEINHPGSVFRMQFCYLHDGNGGNNVKSRAERNEIYYNWIEGAYYHELELIGPDPAGDVPADLKREDSDVVGNVLIKRRSTFVTRVGGDGTGETKGRYRFVNNTIIADSSSVFRLFDGIQSIEMHNNVFYRPSGTINMIRDVEVEWTDGEQIAGSNNWVKTGTINMPTQWTGTIMGGDPGFADAPNDDYRPAAGSPLLNNGNGAPTGPPGFPFPNALFPPGFHPPATPGVSGAPVPRPAAGQIDIGAYEAGSAPMTPNAPKSLRARKH
ncbi:MAG: hypothetical protein JXO72_16890 [Vicinamibacteria bacterium]|nr:hypothetical protein [Vicinamibacteria bacterium]